MIIELTGNVEFLPNCPFTIFRTTEQQARINQSWNAFIQNKKAEDFFNGDIFLVTQIKHCGDNYYFNIGKTQYSELVYIRETGELKARSLFVAAYIVTSDNYYCVIKDKRNRINTIGGLADILDFLPGNVFSPERCLRREIKEELGMDILCNEVFSEYKPQFLKIPANAENDMALYPVGVLYEIKTSFNRHELLLSFEENRKRTDGEIAELMFYNQENYKQLEKDGIAVSYIEELLDKLMRIE